jgi:hypothetical protein
MQRCRHLMHNRHARNGGHLGQQLTFEVRWSTSRPNLTFRPDRSTVPNTRQTLARPMPSPLAMAVALRLRPAAATQRWRAHGCSPGSRAVVDECRHVLVHDRLPSVALVLVPPAHSDDLPPRGDIVASGLGLRRPAGTHHHPARLAGEVAHCADRNKI